MGYLGKKKALQALRVGEMCQLLLAILIVIQHFHDDAHAVQTSSVDLVALCVVLSLIVKLL